MDRAADDTPRLSLSPNLSEALFARAALCAGAHRSPARVAASFDMDWNSAATDWGHFKCEVRSRWSRLGEMQLDRISGSRALLAFELRRTYEWTAEKTERQICSFELLNLTPRAVSLR